MYTGLRKSGTTKVGVFTCEAVTPVSITADGEFMLDGKPIPLQTLEKMAKVDGFESADRFIAFFRKTYGFPFEDAVLIEWNPNSWRWGGNDRAEDKALVVDFLRMNNPDLLELEPAEEKS
jgi:hypothetical protein